MVVLLGLTTLSDPGNWPVFSEDTKLHDSRNGSIAWGMNKFSSKRTSHGEIPYLENKNK